MGWAATYGGGAKSEHACSVQQTHDGGYIVGGWTDSFGAGGRDIWVLKLRPDGTVEWQKSYGGDSSDSAKATQQTSDGGYIVAGSTDSFGAGKKDVWVLKLGADGAVEWQKTYGGAEGAGAEYIQQTRDGGYIVAGHAGFDVWVLKLRPYGTIEWQKTYDTGFGYDWVFCIHETSDGGYIMAGDTSHSSTKGGDLWVLKLNSDGEVEWQKTYGGDELDRAHCIHETRDGGYIVAGRTDSSCVGRGFPDIWVLKLRADGTVEWQKVYGVWYGFGYGLGRAGWDEAQAIHETSDGGYILLGLTGCGDVVRGTRGSRDEAVLLLKLRADGTIEWQKTYGERGFSGPPRLSTRPVTGGT